MFNKRNRSQNFKQRSIDCVVPLTASKCMHHYLLLFFAVEMKTIIFIRFRSFDLKPKVKPGGNEFLRTF